MNKSGARHKKNKAVKDVAAVEKLLTFNCWKLGPFWHGKKKRGIKVTKVQAPAVHCPASDSTEERLIARGMKSGHNYFPIMAQMHPLKKKEKRQQLQLKFTWICLSGVSLSVQVFVFLLLLQNAFQCVAYGHIRAYIIPSCRTYSRAALSSSSRAQE